ncbi:hypothetical protein C2S51_019620 [Perilla frutescens var. frutescens]|nr:hypothetical protein C2S51_019620 [Perilla frutescens var. frutescens]
MEPRNKKSRKNHERRGEKHDLDRLSSLPDSILTHIFSFLDSESVIRTSVLSKRYKLLWTLSPCLDFRLSESDNGKFNSNDGRFPTPANKPCVSSAFESYVTHVLQFREHSNLVKFRLSLHKDIGWDFAKNCVRYAAEHKVQHFRIRGYFDQKPLALPKLLLFSQYLISLNLRNATTNNIELPKSVSLPNLKLLCLKNFEFSDKNYNGELFSGCPRLETLFLYKCSIKPVNKLKVLDVNCSNLRHLEIKRWRSPWRCFDEHMINVNAPKLAFFQFQGHLVRVNFKEVLLCLERACFDLFFPIACFMVNASVRMQKTSECFLNMLLKLCNAKVISLSLKTIEIVCSLRDLRSHAPVIFENLRVIKFTAENRYSKKTIPIETVSQLLEKIGTEVLIFDGYKGKKVLYEGSKAKSKNDARHISIPSHFMQFLLESSPAAELLTLEIPNLSDEE